MFDVLTRGFRQARNRLAGLSEITEQSIDAALREVRVSLLEADVDLALVKAFLARVKERAVGQTVQTRVKHAGQTLHLDATDQFVKICHDELVAMMAHEGEPLAWSKAGPTGILLVGLQGSGKTTTAAKLAVHLRKAAGKRPLLVAADMQRPAAVEQLQILGRQVDVPVFNVPGQSPVEICARAADEARRTGADVIVYDTAGRLAIDEALMREVDEIKAATWPEHILLVVDAMIGQDAVRTAKAFHDTLHITGVILTKLDGDARGGAALSIREVTGAPVLFVGMGEQADKLEEFRAEGMASRILGMGDVVGLVRDFEEVVDRKKAEEDAARLLQGDFSLEDFLEHLRTIQRMGPLRDLVDKMPGMSEMIPEGFQFDEKEIVRVEAAISSMTRQERRDPYVLVREPGRVGRVARGSGTTEQAVDELVQRFLFVRQMMSGLGQNLGLLGHIPGVRQVAMARRARRAMAAGAQGFPAPGMGMPGMGMPGMGMPGMGMPGMPGMGYPFGMPGAAGIGGAGAAGGAAGEGSGTRMRPLTQSEKNARKAQRKRERDARKKNRK